MTNQTNKIHNYDGTPYRILEDDWIDFAKRVRNIDWDAEDPKSKRYGQRKNTSRDAIFWYDILSDIDPVRTRKVWNKNYKKVKKHLTFEFNYVIM